MTEPRVRQDIQTLIDQNPRVIDDYARGVHAMRQLDPGSGEPQDPLSWRYQAAIHGFPGVDSTDDPRLFGTCRHFSWYFLAWHRLYLFFFERVVQFHVQDPTWSLPYWDYTKTADGSSRVLPEPFRSPRTNNPLFTDQRRVSINRETSPVPLPFPQCDARPALVESSFTGDPADASSTFGGGIVDDLVATADAAGALENVPHGAVHMLVGGTNPFGWMSSFDTAGLDPIFWLHHCNLDRLWDVWIGMWGADALPLDDAFLLHEFEFFDSDGTRATKRIGDILVSKELGYVYESTDPPDGTPVPTRRAVAPEGARVAEPELVAATGGVDFSRRSTVAVKADASARRAVERKPEQWYLRVENVTGESPGAAAYDVYLDVPDDSSPGQHPQHRVGSVSSFGVPEATRRGSEHAGAGVTHVFDITNVVDELGNWDPAAARVTVQPVDETGEVQDGGDVRAGRISIYAG
ncbi:MAG TPA: tyrosinase family protein [Thermoleophilaceae bacterium]|nr:tyrosinase family protein [Thermoleophilaceae bacterium]